MTEQVTDTDLRPGRFAYMGDHDETKVLGLTFPKGKPVMVSDPKAAKKLRGNTAFAEMDDKGKTTKEADPKHAARSKGGAKERALAWVGEPNEEDKS